MQLKIKRLNKDAVLPRYSTTGSACFDLYAITKKLVEDKGFGYVEYGTGLAMEIPKGHVGLLLPRSSISNTGMLLANSIGVIDSDYRGQVCALMINLGIKPFEILPGDRVCQGTVVKLDKSKFEMVAELGESDRAGGFGSTGAR